MSCAGGATRDLRRSEAARAGRARPCKTLARSVIPPGCSGSDSGTGYDSSRSTLRSYRVRLIEGADGGYVELQGTPEMVLEVISRSSEKKDTVVLMKAYWEAGIPEYWLVDARKEPLKFDILRHTSRGYVAARK